jgi:serine/threonine-protein kinase
MTERDDSNSPSPDETKKFSILDQYVEQLHAGKIPRQDQQTQEHPELSSMFDCLEALDSLAPRPEPARSRSEVERIDLVKYELLEEIGRGGMGVVYRARQKDLDRFVAVKMILSHLLASQRQIERFYAEARAAGRLSHPHIVRVLEVGEVLGQHYFAMDFVRGSSLAELLERGPLPAEKAAGWLAPIARAVEYLHQQEIIHRDLKPSNILLDEREHPYLTDFGLAKMLVEAADHSRSEAIVGTPSYMAPEQVAGGSTRAGPLLDVYGLGAILYEMLTGQPPFRGETPIETLTSVLDAEPVPPHQLQTAVSRELENVCLKCLEKNPAARYARAAEVAEDLERFLRGEGLNVHRGGVGTRFLRWFRRQPALVSRLLALGLCGIILQLNYHLDPATIVPERHWKVQAVLLSWVLASVVFQWSLQRQGTKGLRLAWAGIDVVMLTMALYVGGVFPSPLSAGYPFLIAASGLWYRVPMILFMTLSSMLGYGLLWFFFPQEQPTYQHVIFLAVLALLGLAVGAQVRRVRILSRHLPADRPF